MNESLYYFPPRLCGIYLLLGVKHPSHPLQLEPGGFSTRLRLASEKVALRLGRRTTATVIGDWTSKF